jgi:hypothetical protein
MLHTNHMNLLLESASDILCYTIGGIIALGLAMTDHSVAEMRTKFLELSERTFKNDRGGPLSKFDPLNVLPAFLMTVKAWESKYKTTPLRLGLISLFGSNKSMFPSAAFTGNQRTVRVAVTSTTSGDPCIFTNYNRLVSTGMVASNIDGSYR